MAEIYPINLNATTVFFLGAGASQPYGLPLGEGLKQAMISRVYDSKATLINNGFETSLCDEFIEALSKTSHPVIDIFLSKKTQYRDIGAYLIAFTLLPLERETKLFPAHNWYAHLYHVIDFEHDEPDINNISFVTLNYDRSLEHFLKTNYKNDCSQDRLKIAEYKAENINVIHAYGSLGSYPKIPYGRSVNQRNVLRNAAETIRIVSDRIEDSEAFLSARAVIKDAHNLVFIGFGYDPTTLESLLRDIDLSNKRILGTTFKLDASRLQYLHDFFKGKMEESSNRTEALQFIKYYLPHNPH